MRYRKYHRVFWISGTISCLTFSNSNRIGFTNVSDTTSAASRPSSIARLMSVTCTLHKVLASSDVHAQAFVGTVCANATHSACDTPPLKLQSTVMAATMSTSGMLQLQYFEPLVDRQAPSVNVKFLHL